MPNCSPTLRHALAGLAACAASQVGAAEWSVHPAVQWGVDYDSNRRLAVTGEDGNEAGWLAFDGIFRLATDTTQMDVQPHVKAQRFAGDSALDATDTSLQWALQNKGEMSSLSLSAGYSRDSTLTTELVDTGIIDASTRRDTTSASATFGRDFTERQHVDFQASYADVRYPNGLRLGLVGYHYPSLNTTYTYGLSSLTSLTATAFADRLTVPVTNYESHDLGTRFGMSHSFSSLLSLSASAGVTRTISGPQQVNGYVGQVQATRSTQLAQWSLSYDRSVQPSGLGVLVRRDEFGLSGSRSVAPQLNLTLSLHSVHNEDLVSGFTHDNRRYLAGDTGVEWRPSLQWIVTLTSGFDQARASLPLGTAHGWHCGLTTRWSPVPMSISR